MTVKISNMTATFTDATIDYDAIGMNVTDAASGANSTLINLKYANSSAFKVTKNSALYTNSVISSSLMANSIIGSTVTANSFSGTSLVAQTISANSILLISAVPASANAAGITGQIATDANSIYVCTAPNTWKKTAISSW